MHNPLWMPPGSVRAILALTLIGATIYMAVVGGEIPQVLGTLAAAVVAFYFGSRASKP